MESQNTTVKVVGIVAIVVIIVLAFYFWDKKDTQDIKVVPLYSTSTETRTIESDLNNTDFDSMDRNGAQLESELNF